MLPLHILTPIALGIVAGIIRPFIYGYLDLKDASNIGKNIKYSEYLFSIFNIIFTLLVAFFFTWNEVYTLLAIVGLLSFILTINFYKEVHQ